MAIAVVILYVLHFANNGSSNQIQEEVAIEDTTQVVLIDTIVSDSSYSPSKALNFPIAYVDIDRINEEYEYIIKGRNRIQGRQKWLQNDIEKKGKDLQEQYQMIMTQAQSGQISEDEARKMMMNLEQQQQKHMMTAQRSEENIAKEGQEFLEKSNADIRAFIEKNKDEFKYSYVFMSGMGSNLLYGNDSLDITDQLLDALNADYKANKKKK